MQGHTWPSCIYCMYVYTCSYMLLRLHCPRPSPQFREHVTASNISCDVLPGPWHGWLGQRTTRHTHWTGSARLVGTFTPTIPTCRLIPHITHTHTRYSSASRLKQISLQVQKAVSDHVVKYNGREFYGGEMSRVGGGLGPSAVLFYCHCQ